MTNLLVRYLKEELDAQGAATLTLLGSETLDGVAETLLPGFTPSFQVYCTKKFTNNAIYSWLVAGVNMVPSAAGTATNYEVVLKEPYVASPVEYLQQTISKSGSTVEKIIRQGSLVEVDYGFVQSIGKDSGDVKTNKRYSDTIQKGEMHKRRLCIVVKVRGTTVQVVPITSRVPSSSDKTSFQIDPTTLAKLFRYGRTGKDSYAICSMIATVSISRVLPPETPYRVGNSSRQGRNVAYPTKLSGSEVAALREALMHAIGVTDYADTKEQADKFRHKCHELAPLPAELAGTKAYVADLETRTQGLEPYKQLARKWAGELGLNIEEEIGKMA